MLSITSSQECSKVFSIHPIAMIESLKIKLFVLSNEA